MRYYKNQCSSCLSACPEQAIHIGEEGIEIDEERCLGCFLCTAACKYGAIVTRNTDFMVLIKGLKAVERPTLGCSVTAHRANSVAPCLGFLSEEHIIVLWVLLRRPLTINLSQCMGCKGISVLEALWERLRAAEGLLGLSIRIILETDEAGINYIPPVIDRRGFFKALKERTLYGASALFNQPTSSQDVYSAKSLPESRRLLNTVLDLVEPDLRERLLSKAYYSFYGSELCHTCQSCIGMCPTGALKVEDDVMLFNTSLCIGCNLCEEFCVHQAARLEKGYIGNSLFSYQKVSSGADRLQVAGV